MVFRNTIKKPFFKTLLHCLNLCENARCSCLYSLILAVQHSRDGLGKRKEAVKRHAPESQPSSSTPSSSSTTSDYSTDTSNNNMWSPLTQRTSPTTSPSATDLSSYNSNYIYTTTNGVIQGAPVIHTFANLVSLFWALYIFQFHTRNFVKRIEKKWITGNKMLKSSFKPPFDCKAFFSSYQATTLRFSRK